MPEAQNVSGSSQEHLKCVNKVVGYPMVSSLLNNVQTYYQTAKQSYKVLNYLETGVTSSYQWIAPKVEPVLQNETFKKYSEPLIASLDDFSCRQLDNLEKMEKNLENKVSSIKQTTYALAETGQEKIAVPIDTYLKESMLGAPLNKILDATDQVCEKYILSPETKVEKQEDDSQDKKQMTIVKYDGPVFKATRISRKLQREAMSKLKDLSLRTPERLKSMVHTVDLIQYAANALDYGVKSTNQFLEHSVYKGMDTTITVLPKMREKITTTIRDSVDALNAAASALSQRAGPVAQIPIHWVEKAIAWEDREIKRFGVIAHRSSETLKEIIASISDHITRREMIPPHLVISATTKINQIIDNLSTMYKTALQKGEAKLEQWGVEKKGDSAPQ